MYIIAQTTIYSAFIAVLGAFFGITYGEISLYLIPLLFIYTAYCLKRLYHFNLSEIILKTFLFIPIFLFFYFTMIIIVGVVIAISSPEVFQQFFDAQKGLQKN